MVGRGDYYRSKTTNIWKNNAHPTTTAGTNPAYPENPLILVNIDGTFGYTTA